MPFEKQTGSCGVCGVSAYQTRAAMASGKLLPELNMNQKCLSRVHNGMKLWIRRILNLTLWLNICLIAGSAGALALRLPHGPGARGLELWGWTRQEWGDFHLWAGVAFLILIVAHLVMAWPWLKNAAAKRHLWPIIGGLSGGIAIALILAFGPVRQSEGQIGIGQGQGIGWQGGRSTP